jgi:hypothetical protein
MNLVAIPSFFVVAILDKVTKFWTELICLMWLATLLGKSSLEQMGQVPARDKTFHHSQSKPHLLYTSGYCRGFKFTPRSVRTQLISIAHFLYF